MTPREDGRRCVGTLCAARSPGDSGAAGATESALWVIGGSFDRGGT